jgi:glycerate kinase
LAQIDWTAWDARLQRCRIVGLCDVTNPLLGPRGSARVFGPQKGATPAQVRALEKFLIRWSRFAPRDRKNKAGAGAAGALAFGLAGFAKARLVSGMTTIRTLTGWPAAARRADIILTGEGRLDRTSFSGKVVGDILRHRGKASVGVICGSTPLSDQGLKRRGVAAVVTLGRSGLSRPDFSVQRAAEKIATNLIVQRKLS